MPTSKPENERLAVLETQMKSLVENQANNQSKYVTKEAFAPVQLIVYGLAGLILSSVIGALVIMVVKR